MITPTGALLLLVPVLPIAIWAAASDMKRMKIPNKSVLAMAAVWPALGWLAVPTWAAWFWGFAIMAIVLVALYLLYTTGTFGAGDAKYAAAMSGIFVGTPIVFFLALVASSMIGALILHRLMRGMPAIRSRTPDWISWEQKRYFPFGLALSMIVVFYLVAAIWPQV
jgi:prepilin peptidase CpaA